VKNSVQDYLKIFVRFIWNSWDYF